MVKIVKSLDKPIYINTYGMYVGISDMRIRIIDLKNNAIIDDILLTEIISTGVYIAIINIDILGTYLLEAYSNSISTKKTINRVIEVVEYDPVLRIEQETVITRKLQSNKAVISQDGLKVTIYDDDGVTTLKEYDISPDKLIRTPIQ